MYFSLYFQYFQGVCVGQSNVKSVLYNLYNIIYNHCQLNHFFFSYNIE